MSAQKQEPDDEFEIAEAALREPLPVPPPMDLDFLAAAAASRMPAEEVRRYAHGVFMRVGAGPLNECAAFVASHGNTAARLDRRIGDLSAAQAGRHELVSQDSSKPINWNPAVVVRLAWPLLALLVLIAAELVALMSTLEEASHTFKVFDGWLARATFAGLPVVGIPAGWKLLGHWQENPRARRCYWRRVLGCGLVLSCLYVPLVGFVLGSEAWEVGSGEGDDLPTDDVGGAVSLGVLMVTAGLAAGGLLAACCWNKFETTLENLCDYEMVPDKVCAASNLQIDGLSRKVTTTRRLQARFEDRSESIKQSRSAYGDAYVAALTPRWAPPSAGRGGNNGGVVSPNRPDLPDININRNGSGFPKEKRER